MNICLKPSELEVLKFYPYPSHVRYDIAEYDELWHENTGDRHVKQLFELVRDMAEIKHNRRFMDNKVAFKFRHIASDTILYVGYKDGIYKVGLNAYNDFNREIDLTTLNVSEE